MMQTSNSQHFRGETCTGGKHSKVKISVLVGANCDGSENIFLFVTGKSRKPKGFEGIKSFQRKYEANTKKWTSLKNMFVYLMNDLLRKKPKVLLFLDNYASNLPHIPGLKAIKLNFFLHLTAHWFFNIWTEALSSLWKHTTEECSSFTWSKQLTTQNFDK